MTAREKAADRSASAGFSLVEVLVALAVLTVAMTTALVLYDGARKSFKVSENVIDQQQVVRIAFDLMASDLRMAGYNHNPDADDERPDEQIEAAFATAVVLRADLDAGTPAALVPEADLQSSGIFDAVTTGNDEIVGYVLSNPGSNDVMAYFADVGGQTRDGTTEQVQVSRVALTQNAPPYILYRLTLDENAAVVKTPLADNIRSVVFRYFDQAGAEIAPPGGDESDTARRARGAIRRISLEIEGLTRDPDANWIDPDDANPRTERHRKFSLVGDVTPRNLGMRGLADLPGGLVLPAPPITPVLVPGHCRGLYVKWSEPPPDEWHYVVGFEDTDGLTGDVQAGGYGAYLSGLTHDRRYDVWIRAVDPFGNVSEPTREARETTSELSAPREPLNLTATSDRSDEIVLNWDAVTQNEDPIPGDPQTPRLRDFRRYRVQRRKSGDADWAVVKNIGQRTWADTAVTGCTSYEYRVLAEDLCSNTASSTYEVTGIATTADVPRAPQNVEAYWLGADVRVSWQPVLWNEADAPIEVDHYDVYRVIWSSGDPPTDLGLYASIAQVPAGDPTAWLDESVNVPAGQAAFYRVVAVDGCDNASVPSVGVVPQNCPFTGNIVFVTPGDGDDTSGSNTVRVDVEGGAETYVAAKIAFVDYEAGVTTFSVNCPSGSLCTESAGAGWIRWTTNWVNGDGKPHRIFATVATNLGCEMTRSILVGPGLPGGP